MKKFKRLNDNVVFSGTLVARTMTVAPYGDTTGGQVKGVAPSIRIEELGQTFPPVSPGVWGYPQNNNELFQEVEE